MNRYPFLIRNKGPSSRLKRKFFYAKNYSEAVRKALELHPDKFVNYKYAKAMDLISAKVEAAKESKAQGKPVYLIADKDGEFDISLSPLKGVQYRFVNGSEDKNFQVTTTEKTETADKPTKKSIPAQSQKAQKIVSKNSKDKNMAKSAPAKKAAKKAAPAKKEKVDLIRRGGTVGFVAADWKKIEKYMEDKELSIRDLQHQAIKKLVGF